MKLFVPIQVQQFFTLILLLLAGKYLAHIYVTWAQVILFLGSALLIEHTLIYLQDKKIRFISFSSMTTALGILLMVATPHFYLYFIILFLGLLQKHILRINGKHLFNPSNFALISGLVLFFNNMHMVTGQLGDHILFQMFVSVLGASILVRADRWIIPIMFVATYILLSKYLIVGYDPVVVIEDIYARFYSVSFLVFMLFMLTDPRTTPAKYWQQFLFAFCISLIAVYLDRSYGFRVQHLFMALFLLSAVSPLWNSKIWRVCTKREIAVWIAVMVLSLGAIIYVEMHPPYYFEMEG